MSTYLCSPSSWLGGELLITYWKEKPSEWTCRWMGHWLLGLQWFWNLEPISVNSFHYPTFIGLAFCVQWPVRQVELQMEFRRILRLWPQSSPWVKKSNKHTGKCTRYFSNSLWLLLLPISWPCSWHLCSVPVGAELLIAVSKTLKSFPAPVLSD